MANIKIQKLEPNKWRERLHAAIPGGAHTYSRGDDQFPKNAPPLLVKGKGALVWDANDTKYLDYGMALRAVTLGYADERVNTAAMKAIDNGVNLTRSSLTELHAAETLIDLIPSVEMVKFAKNGSNVTTAAVKIARAYTGRKRVCVPKQQPFFSFDDWFIGTTDLKRGIPAEHSNLTLNFDYNDISSLQYLFDEYPDEIAAVMLEPATSILPCPQSCEKQNKWPDASCNQCSEKSRNFLHQVRELCNTRGALLIFDEMITGFRWDIRGAQTFFGVMPDLSTFGKGMANGFSVAAVGGKKEFMQVGSIDQPGQERTFVLSSTHGAEMPGLAAFIETVNIYKENNVTDHLWRYGKKLKSGLNDITKSYGLQEHFVIDGPDISLNYLTLDINKRPNMALRTLFSQEMIRNGVLMPWISISQSHGESELCMTFEAADKALSVLQQALELGAEKFLDGSEIKPVFRSHN